jgi:hypothetical protein
VGGKLVKEIMDRTGFSFNHHGTGNHPEAASSAASRKGAGSWEEQYQQRTFGAKHEKGGTEIIILIFLFRQS